MSSGYKGTSGLESVADDRAAYSFAVELSGGRGEQPQILRRPDGSIDVRLRGGYEPTSVQYKGLSEERLGAGNLRHTISFGYETGDLKGSVVVPVRLESGRVVADKDAAVFGDHKDKLPADHPERQFAEKLMDSALSSGVVRPGQLIGPGDAPTVKDRPIVPAAKAVAFN